MRRTYDVIPDSNCSKGMRGLPASSRPGEIVNLEKIDAIASHILASARYRPGQILSRKFEYGTTETNIMLPSSESKLSDRIGFSSKITRRIKDVWIFINIFV